ncbi:MAG TPA: PIG-L deacetylase family protein [Acidimicrobiales bacterium]|nr:PIG-L deacetylase family protein [Acidimicrobiales bacterium]
MTRSDPDTDGDRGPSGLPVGDLLLPATLSVDLPVPATALAVGAHPDDIEFGCGATLAKWAAAGCRIHHLVLTDGSKGSWDPDADPAALALRRMDECRAAAAVIDGQRTAGGSAARPSSEPGNGPVPDRVLFLQRVDGELVDGVDERREVARIIRTVRPEVLLGHDPWRRYRLHPDHRAAGFLTVDAVVGARDPHFFSELGIAPHRPGSLLLWEADLPNHLEAVAGFESTKIDALLCHHSQGESTMGLGDGEGNDGEANGTPRQGTEAFASKVRRQLAGHGALGGLGSAEAFHLMNDL